MKLLGKYDLSESLIRFLVVGSAAFAVEYGSFYGFYSVLHWRLYIANSVSFILGLITSFSLNRIWTFKSHQKQYSKKASHQFGSYALLAIINFGLTNLIVEILSAISLNPRYGKLIAMVTTSLWNYFLFKFVIFNHKQEQPDTAKTTLT